MTTPTNDDRLIDHCYDGIQEYDNPLPRWWVYLFWATIVFSILYVLNVPFIGIGKGRIADYEADVAAWLAKAPPPSGASGEQLAALAGDASALAEGRKLYGAYCASCHRADGGGLIGPNLTDDAWIHGGALDSIRTVIDQGVLAKGMPNWGKILRPEQVTAVTVYVASLRGSNPPNAKAAEGIASSAGDAPAPSAGGPASP